MNTLDFLADIKYIIVRWRCGDGKDGKTKG